MIKRHLQLTRRALMGAAALVLLLSAGRVHATNHDVHIEEVMAGANGNSKIQFIVLRQEEIGQNLWGPTNGIQSAAMLVFFDATGRETGKFKFPANPPTAGTLKTLVATQEFANLPGAPRPDVIIPPLVNPISGQVCFRNNPQNAVFARNECLSYGNFTGDVGVNSGGLDGGGVPAGPPAPALPIMNAASLRRTADTSRNSDFTITATPTPTNIAGATFTIPVAAQVVQGENLFNNETFQGNGRTCASCHVQSESFRLPPANVQARFATLSSTFDPQFIGETAPTSFDAGFDFNLNRLVLTTTTVGTPPTPLAITSNAPCTGELRGIITSAGGGRAKVLTRISDTTYLVYGGINPPLSGTVSDSNSCSATVAGITPGDLNNLEDPGRMRTSRSSDFPQGRALILENIDGFGNPPVFRKSPQMLNVSRTAPFGFSGDIPDLETFTAGAVRQHFPRTLARAETGGNPDFRVPTADELAAMKEFMLAQEFPPGNDPNKFDLNRFVTTEAEQRGRDAFFGNVAKCSMCHGGPVLAQTTTDILGEGIGVNGRFNTGVVNQPINSGGVDNLPCEGSPCGSRKFSVPQLFNVKNLGPFFHDGSAATLRQAVEFYDSLTFNNSQAGIAINGISLSTPGMIDDIVAFLQGLTFQSISANSSTTVTGSTGGSATPLPSVRVLDKNGSPLAGVSVTFAVSSGAGTLSGAIQTTDASGIATVGNWILGAGPSAVTATAAGSFAGNPVTFTAIPLPTLSSITPNNASRGVTVAVTLTGTNFLLGATTVAVNGNGVTVSNVGVVSPTSISARFTVAADAPQGGRSVTVTTAGGTSAAATFSINVPGPALNTLSPTSGPQGSNVVVTLSGNNFFPGDTTIAITGPGVTISNINVSSLTSMSATFAIASDAPLGARNVTVMTSGGTSAPRPFTITGPAPTLTTVSPNTGAQNTSINVTLTGANFVPGGTTINAGAGIAVNNTNVVSATSMTATFVIAPDAPLGARNVIVTTGNGSSSPVIFTVSPGVPILSSISPSFGVIGNSVNVTMTGAMFASAATTIAISGAGVTVSNPNVIGTTQITATFAVASDATVGPRSVTVTTPGGTSGAVTFNVFDPFPDLTVSSTHTGTFAPGFNETYSLTARNVGTLAASSVITVTDTLPSGMSFVSASGVSWTCSATGQIATCTRTEALPPGLSPPITLTVAVTESAAGLSTNIVTVSTAGDLNPANNAAADATTVTAIPAILAVIVPITLTPGQQASVQLNLAAPFPREITGTLSIVFVPAATVPLDDPAIQFATGGRQIAFTFSANTTQARFAGQFQPGSIGFQTGTVAGTLNFGGTLVAGSIQKPFASLGGSRTIPPAPPLIRATKTTQQPGGFTATITLMSVTREVTDLSLTFNTTPAIKLTCGGLAGCTVNGSTMTFSVKQVFDGWYASDTTFGSLSTLTLPFTIQGGTVRGTVNVSLRNAVGLSNVMGFNLP